MYKIFGKWWNLCNELFGELKWIVAAGKSWSPPDNLISQMFGLSHVEIYLIVFGLLFPHLAMANGLRTYRWCWKLRLRLMASSTFCIFHGSKCASECCGPFSWCADIIQPHRLLILSYEERHSSLIILRG